MKDEKIVHLRAPCFKQEQVIRYQAGVRPAHAQGPQLFYELIKNQDASYIVIHNYGHAGCGWTFAPASVQLSYEYMLKGFQDLKDNPKKYTVAVLGAGVNGLMTANYLAKQGFSVTLYAENFSPYTTSDKAPAIFSPPANVAIYNKELLQKLVCISYRAYDKLASAKKPEYKGVVNKYLYTFNDDAEMGLLVKYGLILPGEPVKVCFTPGGAIQYGVRYKTFFIDTAIFMEELMRVAHERGIKFVVKKITEKKEFTSFAGRIVFNCLGLGAQTILEDSGCIPIQGQVVHLKNQPDVDYMLFAKNADGTYTHWIPKRDHIFVGGTYTPYVNLSDPEESVCKNILQRAQAFIDGG